MSVLAESSATESAARLVVLTPDLVGAAAFDTDCASVLRLWSDGRIRPAVNRRLLVRYLRVIRALGSSDKHVRWWSWWIGSGTHSLVVQSEENSGPGQCAAELCQQLAKEARADCVVHSGLCAPSLSAETGGESTVLWLAAAEFERRLNPAAG